MSDQSSGYALERNSRVMCYIPAAENQGGGHLLTPIELCLDEVSDSYFEKISDLVNTIQIRGFDTEQVMISGDFRWHVEIGAKETKAQDLTTIFASQAFQVIPSELLQLQKLLMNAIRDADGRPVMPEPTHNQIGLC